VLLTTTLGLGDTANFTYDKNTGRMTQYSASVGATPIVISGSLTWNQNGTLAGNNIVDGYNSADTQNCTYLYDDLLQEAESKPVILSVQIEHGKAVYKLNGKTVEGSA
jgi:hypothetical protein